MDRGLNELDTFTSNLHPNPKPFKQPKRAVKTSFSVPLQTLHEEKDEEFGFTKIKLAPLMESNKKTKTKKEVRKIDISAPIPIENQPPIEMRQTPINLDMLNKPSQVSTMKINMQPVKRSKSFAHKGTIEFIDSF